MASCLMGTPAFGLSTGQRLCARLKCSPNSKGEILRVNVGFALRREESQDGLLLQGVQNWDARLSFGSKLGTRVERRAERE